MTMSIYNLLEAAGRWCHSRPSEVRSGLDVNSLVNVKMAQWETCVSI